jgi:hypothetical protein
VEIGMEVHQVNLAIRLLDICPKVCKSTYKRDTCTIFIAALFTIAKQLNQPGCPRTDERIKKMCHIYTMEYYSAIKKNEIMPFLGK